MNSRITNTNLKQARSWLGVFLLMVALAGGREAAAAESGLKGTRPNVVFFLGDDQSLFDHTSYGHPTVPTPTTETLSKESLVFDHAFTGQAICAPSRSMLYTGLYPLRNGCFFNHSKVRPGVKTLPQYLKKLGYTVILAGKSHVGPNQRFTWSKHFPPVEKAERSRKWIPIADIEQLLAHPGPAPFCLIVASEFPHSPYMENTPYRPEDVVLPPFLPTTEASLKNTARYYSNVAEKEAELAALLDVIEKHGQKDKTVLFYADDHGLGRGKFTAYDSGLNVAFMVRWPGKIKPGRTDALISFADFVPTVIELAGGTAPHDLDGRSLVPLFEAGTGAGHEYVYGVTVNQGIIDRHVFPQRSVRDARYHYIHSFNTVERLARERAEGKSINYFLQRGAEKHPDIPEEMLFDSRADPHEMTNLAGKPELAEIQQRLKTELVRWMKEQGDYLTENGPVPFLETGPRFSLDQPNNRYPYSIPADQVGTLKGKKIAPHKAPAPNADSAPGPATSTPAVDWQAQWIWDAEDGPPNSWMAFRKSVTVDSVPDTVTAHISADSKYWMWINGELVVFEGSVARGPSPARPWKREKEIWELPPAAKPSNTWYEEVDITRHLQPGENTIAVLAWYWGNETHKGTHIDSGKGGFIFQADVGGQALISDRSWKVKPHPAYALDSGDTGKNILQYHVKYDARNEMGDWTAPDYADADWKAASEKGIPPAAPWYNLEKNYVPALVNHGLQFYENYPESTFPFVSTGATIAGTLPFNQQITPWLEIECSEGGLEIGITTDNQRNMINGFYTTRKGRQSFESYSWMNGHQVNYEIPEGVKVLGLKYRWMSVGNMAGSFACSDPFFERLWRMGRNTLFVCARDNFMDCPDRERACWIGDVADQASYLFYCMDDAGRKLLKKAIRVTMAYSHEGVFAGLGPLRLRELPSQSLQFVDMGIWEYYLNTGDEETLRYAYPYVRDYLKLWSMGPDGLPKPRKPSLDSWNWSDWGVKETIDQKVILDSLYYMALTSAKKMALKLGENDDTAWYEDRIQMLRKAFNNAYWTGSFYSSRPQELQDDRANCLTILSGLAGTEKYDSIVEKVLIPNRFCSPHFEWMVEEAMCQAGFYDAALTRMKERYQLQVDRDGLTTLYEMLPQGGTYNHAWNAPNTILSKHIAGIAPTKPGWSEYQVLPNMAHLTSIDQVVPSVKGDIRVSIRQDEESFDLDLVSPEGTMAFIGIPKSIWAIAEVRANGKTVWRKGRFSNGGQAIAQADEDEKFLQFNLGSGRWKISATAR